MEVKEKILEAQQLVDTRNLRRIGPHHSPPSGERPPPATGLLATMQATPAAYRDLLEFQDLATSSSLATPPKHGVEHVLETTGRPVQPGFAGSMQTSCKQPSVNS